MLGKIRGSHSHFSLKPESMLHFWILLEMQKNEEQYSESPFGKNTIWSKGELQRIEKWIQIAQDVGSEKTKICPLSSHSVPSCCDCFVCMEATGFFQGDFVRPLKTSFSKVILFVFVEGVYQSWQFSGGTLGSSTYRNMLSAYSWTFFSPISYPSSPCLVFQK